MKKIILLLVVFVFLLSSCGGLGGGLGNIVVGGKSISDKPSDESKNEEGPVETDKLPVPQTGGVDIAIRLDKKSYDPGEKITVTILGDVTEQMISEYASIIIFKAGAGHAGKDMGAYEDLKKGVTK